MSSPHWCTKHNQYAHTCKECLKVAVSIGHVEGEGRKESWSIINRERGELIDKSLVGSLNTEERRRLDALQAYADYYHCGAGVPD